MKGFIEVTIIGFELKDIQKEMKLKMTLNCRFINNVYDNKIIYRYNDCANVQYTTKRNLRRNQTEDKRSTGEWDAKQRTK